MKKLGAGSAAKPTVLLVDGYSLIFRGFHALPLLSSGGVFTNAVQGFFSMLFKALAEYQPEGLCVMLDAHAPTFRHTLYENYKGTRKPMPEELRPQLSLVRELLSAMGIAQFEIEGYEADDLLGTAARMAGEKGWNAYILTGDRDSFQLIDESTRVLLTKTGISESLLLDSQQVKELYGYTPAQAIDMKALMGDSSDNIPGIAGIGEKTALKLLTQYGTLEQVLAHAGEVKGKLGEKLQNGREAAELSRELGTICCTVPLTVSFEQCHWKHLAQGVPLLQKYQLNRLVQVIHSFAGERALEGSSFPEKGTRKSSNSGISEKGRKAKPEQAVPQPDEPKMLPSFPECVRQKALLLPQTAEEIARELADAARERGNAVAIHVGLREVTVCTADGRLWFIPLALDMTVQGMYEDQALKSLQILLQETPLVVHGAKVLYDLAGRFGLPMPITWHDTMLGAYLLHPGQKGFGLPISLQAEYGYSTSAVGRLSAAGRHAEGKDVDQESPLEGHKDISDEREPDAYDVFALAVRQRARLTHKCMLSLLLEMEQPLTRVLNSMEREGFGVDIAALDELGQQFTTEIEGLRQDVYRLTDSHDFNLNSPKQLGEILFEKLGLPAGKKGKSGTYSTDASVLEGLVDLHPAIEPLLRYRKLSKLQSTYVEGLSRVVDQRGRVHTTFDQTATLTGRISSLEPNLQNIPVRSEEGREIRKAFVARQGYLLLDADYSQIELRVLAHLSGDSAMQDAFIKGQDIHARTAAEIHGVPLEAVTPLMRRSAKAVNFGIVYGISGFGLARNIGIARKEADAFIATYFERYPGVHAFMKRMVKQGYDMGYTETLFHRRRELPELLSSNHNVRAFGERAAMNTPVQGTAADIIKLAMCRVYERLQAEGLQAKLILQVHDELVVECPFAEKADVTRLLQEAMENVVKLDVPLIAEVSEGKSWFEAH